MAHRIYYKMVKPTFQPDTPCQRCGAILEPPWWWCPKRTPYQRICNDCHAREVLTRAVGRALYGPDPPDPRYA